MKNISIIVKLLMTFMIMIVIGIAIFIFTKHSERSKIITFHKNGVDLLDYIISIKNGKIAPRSYDILCSENLTKDKLIELVFCYPNEIIKDRHMFIKKYYKSYIYYYFKWYLFSLIDNEPSFVNDKITYLNSINQQQNIKEELIVESALYSLALSAKSINFYDIKNVNITNNNMYIDALRVYREKIRTSITSNSLSQIYVELGAPHLFKGKLDFVPLIKSKNGEGRALIYNNYTYIYNNGAWKSKISIGKNDEHCPIVRIYNIMPITKLWKDKYIMAFTIAYKSGKGNQYLILFKNIGDHFEVKGIFDYASGIYK